jgi:DNA repair photolyase
MQQGVERRVGAFRCVEIAAKSVLTRMNAAWDGWSVNPYVGCAHGCVFCFARRYHTFYDDDGLTSWREKIYVKTNAPLVVRNELRSRYDGKGITLGIATDAYQPVEGSYRLTRRILEELVRAEAATHLITRSPLVVRDADLWAALAAKAETTVVFSIPTMDAAIAREIEPGVAPPHQRMRALKVLAARGINAVVAMTPVLPHITDAPEQMAAVARAANEAGATAVWGGLLNLGPVARESTFAYLRDHRPHLLPAYESLFPTKYVAKHVAKTFDAEIDAALRTVPFTERETIVPQPSKMQLSLL